MPKDYMVEDDEENGDINEKIPLPVMLVLATHSSSKQMRFTDDQIARVLLPRADQAGFCQGRDFIVVT